jgi:hypothetical protein
VESENGLLFAITLSGDPMIETDGRRKLLTNNECVPVEHEPKTLHSVKEKTNELSGTSRDEGIGAC